MASARNHEAAGRYQEAADAYEQAGATDQMKACLGKLAEGHERANRHIEAAEVYTRLGDEVGIGRALFHRGLALATAGDDVAACKAILDAQIMVAGMPTPTPKHFEPTQDETDQAAKACCTAAKKLEASDAHSDAASALFACGETKKAAKLAQAIARSPEDVAKFLSHYEQRLKHLPLFALTGAHDSSLNVRVISEEGFILEKPTALGDGLMYVGITGMGFKEKLAPVMPRADTVALRTPGDVAFAISAEVWKACEKCSALKTAAPRKLVLKPAFVVRYDVSSLLLFGGLHEAQILGWGANTKWLYVAREVTVAKD